jgi:hypothetical protein
MRPHLNTKSWAWWHLSSRLEQKCKQDCNPGWPRQKVRSHLQNNWSKKGWRCGSGGRAPA